MLKNGTSASPAMALASRVLPVPGAPTSSTPRGMRPPRRWNFSGFAQELDDLLDLFLGLVDAGDVGEGHPALICRKELGLGLGERVAATAAHAAVHPQHEIDHDAGEEQNGSVEAEEQTGPKALLPTRAAPGDGDVLRPQLLHQVGILRGIGLEQGAVAERADDACRSSRW